MALDMQSATYNLHEKFGDLQFYENGLSTNMSNTCKKSSFNDEPYDIKPITKNDVEIVLDHLRKSFFLDEPLNVHLQLLDERNPTCKELEEYSRKSMSAPYSLMAMSQSGKIIGACLNVLEIRNAPEVEEKECHHKKFRKILNLISYVDSEAKIFEQFPDVDKVINCHILSVDSTWRGRGIAKKLIDKTRDIALEQGFGLMRVVCSSHFSARAFAKLDFKCVYTLKYQDYKDDGETTFNPGPPHTELTVYVQRITKDHKL